MDEFSINDNSFNSFNDYINEEAFQDVQENVFSYAETYGETYGEEAFHVVQGDINFQVEGYDEAHNNFQEGILSNIGSHDEDDYESIQEDSIQKDSLSRTKSYEEVQ
ncbi:13348_t:CDS:1, partial [Racocetra fulgida]